MRCLNKLKDRTISDPFELVARAAAVRDEGQYAHAEELARRALKELSEDSVALSVLCSVLRKRGKPQQALDETTACKNPNPHLLTTRAAAFCDLQRWEEAKREVGRALAIAKGGSDEAFNVVKRIKAARPDLYSK